MSDTPIYDSLTVSRCVAHGKTIPQHDGEDCAKESSRCQCGTFLVTGMHWDTCPGRERS